MKAQNKYICFHKIKLENRSSLTKGWILPVGGQRKIVFGRFFGLSRLEESFSFHYAERRAIEKSRRCLLI